MAVYLYVILLLSNVSNAASGVLEFRNSYVGLDELYETGTVSSSDHAPILNMPRIAAQISRDDPHKVFPEGEHEWFSEYGTLSPPDRHLQVSNDVSNMNFCFYLSSRR